MNELRWNLQANIRVNFQKKPKSKTTHNQTNQPTKNLQEQKPQDDGILSWRSGRSHIVRATQC